MHLFFLGKYFELQDLDLLDQQETQETPEEEEDATIVLPLELHLVIRQMTRYHSENRTRSDKGISSIIPLTL